MQLYIKNKKASLSAFFFFAGEPGTNLFWNTVVAPMKFGAQPPPTSLLFVDVCFQIIPL